MAPTLKKIEREQRKLVKRQKKTPTKKGTTNDAKNAITR